MVEAPSDQKQSNTNVALFVGTYGERKAHRRGLIPDNRLDVAFQIATSTVVSEEFKIRVERRGQ